MCKKRRQKEDNFLKKAVFYRILSENLGPKKTIIEGFIKAFVDIKANLQTSVLKITVLSKLNI